MNTIYSKASSPHLFLQGETEITLIMHLFIYYLSTSWSSALERFIITHIKSDSWYVTLKISRKYNNEMDKYMRRSRL